MSEKELYRVSKHLMYMEVSEKIRKLVRKKELWGKYLAPERELAERFGVSRETIRRGPKLLEGQGVVVRRRGRRDR